MSEEIVPLVASLYFSDFGHVYYFFTPFLMSKIYGKKTATYVAYKCIEPLAITSLTDIEIN